MVTLSRKPVRVPSSFFELFGPRDFTVVAELKFLGQLEVSLLVKRFLAVIGP